PDSPNHCALAGADAGAVVGLGLACAAGLPDAPLAAPAAGADFAGEAGACCSAFFWTTISPAAGLAPGTAAAGSFSGPWVTSFAASLFFSTQRTRPKRLARWKLPWPRIGDQATPELSCMAYRFMRQASPGAGGAALALSNDDHGMRASTT